MSVWTEIQFAPKDGTPVDLWGCDRSKDQDDRLMLGSIPRRWTDCRWDAPLAAHSDMSKLVMPMERGWYRVEDDGGYRRIHEPTHYMEIPKGPNT